VVITPKSLLRHPEAVSSIDEFERGRFEPVLDDPETSSESKAAVTRVVLTSGKVYYELKAARAKSAEARVAIVRLEQFYPWPQHALKEVLAQYPNATEIRWVQEEPRNMGAWRFLETRFTPILRQGQALKYYGRPFSASPATGTHHRHEQQQHTLVTTAVTI
jgi:2-oxoglutarate dehydrogenase E1 component